MVDAFRRQLERKLFRKLGKGQMLTPNERAQLEKLQQKAAEMPEPLTDKDLEQIEKRAADTVGGYEWRFKELVMAPFTSVQSQLHALAADNAHLVAEIRRLRESA